MRRPFCMISPMNGFEGRQCCVVKIGKKMDFPSLTVIFSVIMETGHTAVMFPAL